MRLNIYNKICIVFMFGILIATAYYLNTLNKENDIESSNNDQDTDNFINSNNTLLD